MSVIQPGNLIRFAELAYGLIWKQGGATARLILESDPCTLPAFSHEDLRRKRRTKQSLKPEQAEKAIFLFLRVEDAVRHSFENPPKEYSKVWVLYDEKVWYVSIDAPVRSLGRKYIEKIQ